MKKIFKILSVITAISVLAACAMCGISANAAIPTKLTFTQVEKAPTIDASIDSVYGEPVFDFKATDTTVFNPSAVAGDPGFNIFPRTEEWMEPVKDAYEAMRVKGYVVFNEDYLYMAYDVNDVAPRTAGNASKFYQSTNLQLVFFVNENLGYITAAYAGKDSVRVFNDDGNRSTMIIENIDCKLKEVSKTNYIDNLFFASRLCSVSHLAHGTVRLQRTLATVGMAVGVAAGLCKKYDCSPRDIYELHLEELQQTMLKQDITIMGKCNADENDLARKATVSADSWLEYGVPATDNFVPLDRSRGVMLWDWEEKLDVFSCYLKNVTDKSITLKAKLSVYIPEHKYKLEKDQKLKFPYRKGKGNHVEWGVDNSTERFDEIKTVEFTVAPDFCGWCEIPFDTKLNAKSPYDDDVRYLVTLDKAEGISWSLSSESYDFCRRAELSDGAAGYEGYFDSHSYTISPAPKYCEPENIINGVSRRWSTNPVYMWRSKDSLDDVYECNIKMLRALIPYCEKFGVKVALETCHLRYKTETGSQVYFDSAEKYYGLIEDAASPFVVACIDVGHTAGGVSDYPEKFISDMKKGVLKGLHIQDSDYMHDNHTTPYFQHLNWNNIMKALSDIDYDGDLTFEDVNLSGHFPEPLVESAVKYTAAVGRHLISVFCEYEKNKNKTV